MLVHVLVKVREWARVRVRVSQRVSGRGSEESVRAKGVRAVVNVYGECGACAHERVSENLSERVSETSEGASEQGVRASERARESAREGTKG